MKKSSGEEDGESAEDDLRHQLHEAQSRFRKYVRGNGSEKINPDERRTYRLQLSGQLAGIYGQLAKFEEEEGEPELVGQNLEKAGNYLAMMADDSAEEDPIASARYRSESIKSLQEAGRYANETKHSYEAGRIKKETRKQIGKLEQIAGELEKVRRRIAAVILCGVLSLIFSVGKITGYSVGSVGTVSNVAGIIFFVIGCVFLSLVLKKKQVG